MTSLLSNAKTGISSNEVEIAKRKETYGVNEKYVHEPPSFFTLFCEALEDFTLRILIVASIISIVIDMSTAEPNKRATAWIEGVAIMVAVMICATVSAVNDYQKER